MYLKDEPVYYEESSETYHDEELLSDRKAFINYACSICCIEFSSKQNLSLHEQTHSNESTVKCEESNLDFDCYNHHQKDVHDIDNHEIVCFICGVILVTRTGFYSHMRSIHGENFPCERCNETFNTADDLKGHFATYHSENGEPCDICGRNVKNLRDHMNTHLDIKPFQCNRCNKAFSSNRSLKYHMNIHSGERPYVCSDCGKGFLTSSILTEHRRIHTGEKPYSCNQCGKAFTKRPNMLAHMKTHTGEKLLACEECGKTFARRTNMLDHMAVHTDERPHICKICNKGFSLRKVLKRHEKIHTDEKPFMCDICHESFGGKVDLKRHKRKCT